MWGRRSRRGRELIRSASLVAGLLSKDPYGVLLGAVHDKYSASHTCDLNFPSNYTKKAKLDK